MLNKKIKEKLFAGTIIPAFPLALNEDKTLDEEAQRVLTHYYIDSGVGGLAVGVHTTQFEIRDPEFDLYERVLKIAAEEINKREVHEEFIKIAGVCGPTSQAVNEAKLAKKIGYDIVLLSMGNLSNYSEEDLLERTREIAKIIPICGFYLQNAAGGRVLSGDFWKKFVEIDNVVAVKVAPFNRYRTLDVVNAILESERRDEIAIYTGNDDNIVVDLLTPFTRTVNGKKYSKNIVGGLLGHWAVWTKSAVSLFYSIKEKSIAIENLLQIGTEITEANGILFDQKNNFRGSIAGVNEVLHRDGLLKGNWCLSENEVLSENQSENIEKVIKRYPYLSDANFIEENIKEWKELSRQKIRKII